MQKVQEGNNSFIPGLQPATPRPTMFLAAKGRKGELIKDYLQVTQSVRIGYYLPLLIGCDFHVKTIKCKKGDDPNPSITIKLQFWEMAEGQRILLLNICCRNSHGGISILGSDLRFIPG